MQYFVYLLLLELLLRILYLIYLNIKNNRHFLTYFSIKKLLTGNISANEDFVDTKFGLIDENKLKNKFRFKRAESYLNISQKENLEAISTANSISQKTSEEIFSRKNSFEQLSYKPFVGLYSKSNQKLSYANVKSFGMQYNFENFEKQYNTKRVIIIGGSAAFGYGSSNIENNITNSLEKILNENQETEDSKEEIKWEVINLAFVASQTLSDLNLINMYISLLKPNYIIHLAGYNDFFYFFHSNNNMNINKKLFQFNGSQNIINFLYGSHNTKIKNFLFDNFIILKIFKKFLFKKEIDHKDQIYTVF